MRTSRTNLLLIGANLIVLGFVGLVALDMAGVDWRRNTNDQDSPSKTPSVSDAAKPAPLSQHPPVAKFSLLNTADLFGTDPALSVRKEPVQAPVMEETRLNLRLKGTVVGENLSSCAMIMDGRTRIEEVYRENEYVQGARIVSIQKEGIVLQGAKGRELLRLPQPGSEKSPAPRASNRVKRKKAPPPKKQP
jgi:type II secretory pathway component PulC